LAIGGGFNQGALQDAVFKAVAHLERLHFGGKFLDELVVHAALHINAVGTHTGLARVTVLAGDGTFHGRVDVGVIKHDEGRIAAEFQRELFHRGRRLRHQDATHFCAAGEADVTHDIAGTKDLAHSNAVVAVRGEHR